MYWTYIPLIVLLFFPTSVFANSSATFSAGQVVLAASSSPGNAYAAGTTVVLTAPVGGDFLAFGGSITTAARVHGDDYLLAGSVRSRAEVSGDLRAAGGKIYISEPVGGDIVAFGYSVKNSGRAQGSVFIGAVEASVTDGSEGPVTIYGNNVVLGGRFSEDVRVFATGQLTLLASTTIQGVLAYEAPSPGIIPDSAVIRGGIEYTGAPYLPDPHTSRALVFVSIGFFLFVRILGALLLAGLLAGLFPRLAESVVQRASTSTVRVLLLTTLLGFGIFVATPVLLLLLLLTFVGIGVALVLFMGYALLLLLSVMYAGIILGGLLARKFARRENILWRDGVLGMLVLSLIALVPVFGFLVMLSLMLFSAGALLMIFFHTAFPRDETAELL